MRLRWGLRFKIIVSLLGIVLLPLTLITFFGTFSGSSAAPATVDPRMMFISALFILAFVCCAFILTRLVTKNVLIPLQELNAAAAKIMNGDLDFQIEYRNHDEMGRFSAAFELMRARLKESLDGQSAYERSRQELIASISHDLRTPLTSIRGYVEGLQDGVAQSKEKQDRYLAVIRDKTDKLERMIDELLQFSRLELGEIGMETTRQDSREMLEAILSPIENEFDDLTGRFTVERPFPSVPIDADRCRMAQVFENLVGNARKYAGTDAHIAVTATVEEEAGLRIAIRDNGPGIPAEDVPYVFDRFYRGEKSRSRAFGGTGLGLAICKQIVEDHGGTIGVQSIPGAGTEFYFTIPESRTLGI